MGFNFLVIISILFAIYTLLYLFCYVRENYDAKLPEISQSKCGILCTKTLGCYAFAHKPETQTCYLARKFILGQELDSPYSDEYNPDDYRCNKVRAIQGYSDAHVPEALKSNAFYTCAFHEEGPYGLRLLTDKVDQSVGTFEDIDKITIPEYKLSHNKFW